MFETSFLFFPFLSLFPSHFPFSQCVLPQLSHRDHNMLNSSQPLCIRSLSFPFLRSRTSTCRHLVMQSTMLAVPFFLYIRFYLRIFSFLSLLTLPCSHPDSSPPEKSPYEDTFEIKNVFLFIAWLNFLCNYLFLFVISS